LTRRDVVDDQLNATAIHMIHMSVTPKDRAHIRTLKTTKEAIWAKLMQYEQSWPDSQAS
jgi:hypothetical protein